jgi:hypothetical protein
MCCVVLIALGEDRRGVARADLANEALAARLCMPLKKEARRANGNQVGASDASMLQVSIREDFHFYGGSERRNATDIRDEEKPPAAAGINIHIPLPLRSKATSAVERELSTPTPSPAPTTFRTRRPARFAGSPHRTQASRPARLTPQSQMPSNSDPCDRRRTQ